jgi:hypothetical protein
LPAARYKPRSPPRSSDPGDHKSTEVFADVGGPVDRPII